MFALVLIAVCDLQNSTFIVQAINAVPGRGPFPDSLVAWTFLLCENLAQRHKQHSFNHDTTTSPPGIYGTLA
nr:hypothetical protein CFP56_09093 [Quercus suber]